MINSMTKGIPTWLGLVLALTVAAQLPAQQNRQQAQPDSQQQQNQQARAENESDRENGSDEREGPPIYPNLAASLIGMGGVRVIDVRSDQEVEETGTLADAEHIPHTQIDEMVDLLGNDTDRAVIVYCASGRRAGRAIQALRERGYHGMVNAGGFEDLRQAMEEDATAQKGDGDEEG